MFTQEDIDLLARKGITPEKVETQLECFRTGFPFLKLKDSASVKYGVMSMTEQEADHYKEVWNNYLNGDKQILKFVPASGAASRMFKDLFDFLDSNKNKPEPAFEKKFFDTIDKFAFYSDLDAACIKNEGKSIKELMEAGEYKSVVANLLEEKGLNYGNLPKGLLKFHSYVSDNRTAMEEHLVEGALYAANQSGIVNLHFTVSPEHEPLFKALVAEKVKQYEDMFDVKYDISFSVQKSSTDTVAVDSANNPFRDNGKMLFRPGGHGALIANLHDIDADVVFVKNIDNVLPDKFKPQTVNLNKIICG